MDALIAKMLGQQQALPAAAADAAAIIKTAWAAVAAAAGASKGRGGPEVAGKGQAARLSSPPRPAKAGAAENS
jgi:hypothetical protein